jgi:hypothetical protein
MISYTNMELVPTYLPTYNLYFIIIIYHHDFFLSHQQFFGSHFPFLITFTEEKLATSIARAALER